MTSTGPRPCLWARTVRCESPHRPRPPWAVWPYSPSYRLPQPSSRRPFSSLRCPYNAMPPDNRHSGASRNPCPPTTVIPAPAGIHAPQQPSFRRQPESMPPDNRHSGATRNLRPPTTVIPAPARIYAPSNRHSGASSNLCPPTTVIPAQAGIHAPLQPSFRRKPEPMPPLQPSFRRKPESMPPYNRHSGASPNLYRYRRRFRRGRPPTTVIPAQAGIYACRLHYRSRRSRRWIPAQAGTTAVGASQ